MGAAELGLPGKNDIDLDILCDNSEVFSYTQKLKEECYGLKCKE